MALLAPIKLTPTRNNGLFTGLGDNGVAYPPWDLLREITSPSQVDWWALGVLTWPSSCWCLDARFIASRGGETTPMEPTKTLSQEETGPGDWRLQNNETTKTQVAQVAGVPVGYKLAFREICLKYFCFLSEGFLLLHAGIVPGIFKTKSQLSMRWIVHDGSLWLFLEVP